MTRLRLFLLAIGVCAFRAGMAAQNEEPVFERDVRPILKARCFQCHGDEDKPKGGVDLRLRRFMSRELEGGRHIVVPGQPAASEMLWLVKEGEMPKKGGRLPAREVEVIERWIAAGAKTAREEPAELSPGPLITDEERSYWAFQPVRRPALPALKNPGWARNPIDAFVASEHEARGLAPRPEAVREVLLRRVYVDLIGLSPTPAEQQAFLADASPDAFEKVVDRLLADARYGERWARHWMDIWRYSDWTGWLEQNQVRDSHRHIWRWRDWIVESLNADKGYDRMVQEMIAGDELAPTDPNVVRATGFLARNYKLLSREQWLEDTVKHTSQAFLGLTMGCAKCHNHMYDPITQREYYQLRAIFEPHQVRIDAVPGEIDLARDGLSRVFDAKPDEPTWLFHRGDERKPDKRQPIAPGIPRILGGKFEIEKVTLPRDAAQPERRAFAIADVIAANARELAAARAALEAARKDTAQAPPVIAEREAAVALAEAKYQTLLATIGAENLETAAQKPGPAWEAAAKEAMQAQRRIPVAESRWKLAQARVAEAAAEAAAAAQLEKQKLEKAQKVLTAAKEKTAAAVAALAKAEEPLATPATTAYTPRAPINPENSSGRRLALARWITDAQNPLTARVAANHLWLRHFTRGIVPTPADFGRNGRAPSHPQLLDWLAAELVEKNWSMKTLHRLIVTSSTYRMASTPDFANAERDADNVYLWRMPSRRLEAEAVRDNILHAAGTLDLTMGGPEIDHQLGLQSRRRSLYLRTANEREVEFLKIFDGPSLTECYERRPSVVPQQALALINNEMSIAQAKVLAAALAQETGADDAASFIDRAYHRILARSATPDETALCRDFLSADGPLEKRREKLLLILFNHHDFLTIR